MKNMKKAILGIAMAATLGGFASAASAQVYGDTARVISATPIYERDPLPPDSPKQVNERIVGYDVRYEYNGRELRIRLPYDPGQQMAVNVDVRPPIARDAVAGRRTPNYRGPY
jgi:uncharacterized protein YcfJ